MHMPPVAVLAKFHEIFIELSKSNDNIFGKNDTLIYCICVIFLQHSHQKLESFLVPVLFCYASSCNSYAYYFRVDLCTCEQD